MRTDGNYSAAKTNVKSKTITNSTSVTFTLKNPIDSKNIPFKRDF